MDEELNYAEMLEIPVETVTVKHREKKRRREREEEPDLGQKLVDQVNDRMETDDPAYAESTQIERDLAPRKRSKAAHRVLIAEFVAVCALCAVIFLSNIFMTDSAINTFVRGLFRGTTAEAADTRQYSDFTLSPVVNGYEDVEIAVSETGVMTFTAKSSVYPPCAGKLSSVNGNAESGYTVEIKHSDSFSTIISGLDTVYAAEGEKLYANIPVAYSDGEGAVRVMFYSNGALITGYTVNGNNIAWS